MSRGKAASTGAGEEAYTWQSDSNNGKLEPSAPVDLPPKCLECGSQRLFKDGLRYSRSYWDGEVDPHPIQRYQCRNCGRRFSYPNGSQTSERLQRIHRQILSCNPTTLLAREHDTDFKAATQAVTLKLRVMGSKTRREPCNQHEAVDDMESRIQEQAAGATETTINQADVKGKIVEFIWKLKREGYAEATIKHYAYILEKLTREGANLNDPESVKDKIALQETWGAGRKNNAVKAYTIFLKMQGLTWQKPKYKPVFKLPFIPAEKEVDDLIAGCGHQMATFLQLLKETAMRSGEAFRLVWTDIDTVSNTVRIMPEKGSNPRAFKISSRLATMLNNLPKPSNKVFSYKDRFYLGKAFRKQRKRIAHKLGNPRILQIHFHTLRHWKATMEYASTKDILHVMQLLGHKSIENTLKYTQLVNFKTDEYVCKVAHNLDEDQELIETGFEYITERDGLKLYRKRK